MNEHLNYTTTDRGFDRMPPIPSQYPGGSVQVYESSAASGPHIWLTAEAPAVAVSLCLRWALFSYRGGE